MSTKVITLSIIANVCLGHMSMQYPNPRDTINGAAYAVWQQNEPMVGVHPTICHGLDADTEIREGNSFTVGDTITIDIYGSASHAGGHCTFWYSTDDITFTKIIDIKDCTIATSTQVTLPLTMPTACATKCTFAWTWVPVDSGACEIYMNCADISVSGVQGGNSNPISLNFQTSFINAAEYGCKRVDPTTHWTEIMSDLKTEYDESDTVSDGNVVESGNEVIYTTCYTNEELAVNLDNDISNTGICGNTDTSYRCDNSECCSSAGYCGPEHDGTGWINYDQGGYYNTEEDAYNAYCTNALGDWRVHDCTTFVPSNGEKSGSLSLYRVSGILSIVTVFIFFCL